MSGPIEPDTSKSRATLRPHVSGSGGLSRDAAQTLPRAVAIFELLVSATGIDTLAVTLPTNRLEYRVAVIEPSAPVSR